VLADFRKKLEDMAKQKARSISQTCENFMRLGLEASDQEGSKFLQRHLSLQKKRPSG
jgi:hypothetical protein